MSVDVKGFIRIIAYGAAALLIFLGFVMAFVGYAMGNNGQIKFGALMIVGGFSLAVIETILAYAASREW